MNTSKASSIHALATFIILLVLITAPQWLSGDWSSSRIWLGVVVLLWVLIFTLGHWVTGVWRGALIDERNRISLSQTQLVLWTVLVLAGFLTAGLENVVNAINDPLAIEVPQSLWLLMGISTTTLVGSPLLSSRRKAQKASAEEEASALNTLSDLGRDASALNTSGRLIVNDNIADARWSDLFEAEEISRAGRVDMSKVQMTLFTPHSGSGLCNTIGLIDWGGNCVQRVSGIE